jgi:hypothetical protein
VQLALERLSTPEGERTGSSGRESDRDRLTALQLNPSISPATFAPSALISTSFGIFNSAEMNS